MGTEVCRLTGRERCLLSLVVRVVVAVELRWSCLLLERNVSRCCSGRRTMVVSDRGRSKLDARGA